MSREQQFDFYWKEIFDGLAYNPIEFNVYRFDQSMSLPSKFNKLYEMLKVLALNNQEVMDYLKGFVETFDVKLYETIDDILTKWLEDGILTELIRNAINEEVVEARNAYSTLKERLDSEKVDVNTQLSQTNAQLAQTAHVVSLKANTFKPLRVAHRGAEGIAPQNTIPAMEYAGMAGYYGGETDLQITSDKEWVIFHDDTVDFLTDGTGTIATKTLAEVKALNIDYGPFISSRFSGVKIPTLRQFLDVCSKWGMIPFLELKRYTLDDLSLLFDIFAEYNLLDDVVLMADMDTLIYCKNNISNRFNALSLITATPENILYAKTYLPNSIIGINHTLATIESVKAITNAGLQCAVWTSGPSFVGMEDTFKKWGVRYVIGGIL